jgi:DNA polymerase III epsilon subunit-like protein
MTQLIYLDVEATGTEELDRLIQVAYHTTDYRQGNALFKPPVPIKLPAMAVHHVTEAMVADKPAFKGSETFAELKDLSRHHILVAHNAKYDVGMLKKEGLEFNKVICTYKLARYVDDGKMENHQLQYLRYYYGIDVEAVAHDAFGDIVVLQAVFDKLTEALIKKDFPSILLVGDEVHNRMIEISQLPSLLRTCHFKKYKGMLWEDVAKNHLDYIQWFSTQPDLDEDLKYTLNYYLNK